MEGMAGMSITVIARTNAITAKSKTRATLLRLLIELVLLRVKRLQHVQEEKWSKGPVEPIRTEILSASRK